MSGIKSMIILASMALALVIAVGLALGPESVGSRVDEALFSTWQALGDHLATRELSAIARQLERERQNGDLIATLRNSLAERLQSLGVRRECVAARGVEGGLPRETDSDRELTHLDGAIALLRSAVVRADSVLGAAQRDLNEREAELIALRAAADVSQMNRTLTGPIGDPPLWYVRVARARDFLRTTCSDTDERDARFKLSACPD
jgi:hypothetical protein